jgi:hypothetical protein
MLWVPIYSRCTVEEKKKILEMSMEKSWTLISNMILRSWELKFPRITKVIWLKKSYPSWRNENSGGFRKVCSLSN